jgi:hypothetical protein
MLLVVGNRAIPDNIAEEETMSAIPTKSRIHALQYLPVSAALVLTLAAAPAVAQTQAPWVEMESTSVNLGIGGQSGEGVLRLPIWGQTALIHSNSTGSAPASMSVSPE